MKLLFDENLSPKMVLALADVFPNSAHGKFKHGFNIARRVILR